MKNCVRFFSLSIDFKFNFDMCSEGIVKRKLHQNCLLCTLPSNASASFLCQYIIWLLFNCCSWPVILFCISIFRALMGGKNSVWFLAICLTFYYRIFLCTGLIFCRRERFYKLWSIFMKIKAVEDFSLISSSTANLDRRDCSFHLPLPHFVGMH